MTCHFSLQNLFNEVIRHYNCAVLCGRRDKPEQNRAFREGRSKLLFPQSKHNKDPSQAVDVVPWHAEYPYIRWDDREAFYYFGGLVLGVAAMMKIDVRWGGDWDTDQELHDQTFFDLPHFELI